MTEPRFDGAEISLGGTIRVVPPLGMRSLKTLMPKIQSIEIDASGFPTDGSLESVYDLIHAAMKRNYPDLDRDEMIDSFDIHTFPKVVEAVLGQSGLVKVSPGNASRAPAPSIGTPSTPAAAAPSDGLGSTSTNS